MRSVDLEQHQRGAGFLVINVSTIGAADERCWARAERQLPSFPSLQVRANFGPGSAVVSAPWTAAAAVGRDDDSDQLRRDATLHLPYFNLADGVRSTDASLVIEIVTLKHSPEQWLRASLPGDGEDGGPSCSLDPQQTTEGYRDDTEDSSEAALAVGALDVQTTLMVNLRHGSSNATASKKGSVTLELAKKDTGGNTVRSYHDLPDSIPVSVKLTFSGASFSAAGAPGEQRVVRRAGKDDAVPAFFVVATTLFDCATTMKEAELRLYIRSGTTGAVSKFSSGGRGEIVVHESFEWNICANLSTMFPPATKEIDGSSPRRESTLIVALFERSAVDKESHVSRKGRRRGWSHSTEKTAAAVLELSREELVSCGAVGRWCPLRACSRYTHRVARGIIGEALLAFVRMPRGPAADALPIAPVNFKNSSRSRKRPRRTEGGKGPKTHVGEGSANAKNASVSRSVTEPGSSSGNLGPRQEDTLVYIHVWDALLPFDRPGAAFYFTVRLSRRGSRVQRVSTKPTRGRGGAGERTTATSDDNAFSHGASTGRARRSRAGCVHVVWDEHVLLSVVKEEVEEDAVVDLVLRDASAEDGTILAAREGEPFHAFAERHSKRSAKIPAPLSVYYPSSSSSSSSSSSLRQHDAQGPTIYRLRLQHPRGLSEDRENSSIVPTRNEEPDRSGLGFGGAEVRMTCLVVCRNGKNADEAVESFLRRKADVARIPGGVERRLRTVDGGVNSVFFTPALHSALGTSRSRRHSRLLDLSAASGLFQQFAESEPSGGGAVETTSTGWSSLEAEEDGEKTQTARTPWKTFSMEPYQSSSEPILTSGGLDLVTQQHFPGLARQEGHNGVDITPGTSCRSTPETAHQASISNNPPGGMSFAGFVSWLRNLPQEELGTAGLLVSPRTALHKTGEIMDDNVERAQELAATLKLTQEPTATEIDGWCSIPLKSIKDAVALDRVRIGWGRVRGVGEYRHGDLAGEEKWLHHTELLRRDVMVLASALAKLEQRCGWYGGPTGTDTSVIDDRESDGCGANAEADRISRRNEQLKELDPRQTIEGVPSGAVRRQVESGSFSAAILYFEQEAARLGSAAEHLKEAFRCAGDTLVSASAYTPDDQFAVGKFNRARTSANNEWSRVSSRTLLAVEGDGSSPDDEQAIKSHRRYGSLLQHVKQVTSFQAEIAALQKRAAVIALRTREEAQRETDGYRGRCGHVNSRDAELPRSPLALVKRIRHAQNAARRRHPTEHPSLVCSGPTGAGEASLSPSREQGSDDGGICSNGGGLPSSPRKDLPPEEDAELAGEQLLQNKEYSLSVSTDPAAVVLALEGGSTPRALASPRAPFDEMLRRPTSLQTFQRRLERVRRCFQEKAVDIPAPFAATTAQRLLKTASGEETDRPEASIGTIAPPAALCCPIDRFALHIFRTAGVSEEGGSAVYTGVQELAAMGGLDTHASEKSLWTAVAQAGIVDIDRWVVAAVLRQATDAVATADVGCTGLIRATAEHETADLAAVTPERAVFVKEAVSLWEELCEEAFLSVLGRISRRCDHGTTPGAGMRPGAAARSILATAAAAGGKEQPAGLLIPAEEASGGEDDMEQRTRQRYDTLRADPRSFDNALTRALVLAGRGDAGRRSSAVTRAGAETEGVSFLGSPTGVEDILLHNFVIAGFASGSDLDESDIVDAVSVRRQRTLSAVAAAGYASRGVAEEADENVAGSRNSQTPSEGELSESKRRRLLPTEDTAGEEGGATLSENERGAAGADMVDGEDASGGADLDMGVLAGVPAELRGLFRAVELVRVMRKKQQHGQLRVPQFGSSNNDELGAAERAVVRLLDSNRTLESAPFSDGKTALHHAAARGDDFLVHLLLERGCPPYLKDFEGKRACDLTRDLKCLCLLGALQKAPEPSAISLRASAPGEAAAGDSDDTGHGSPCPLPSRARAMTNVEFLVAFRLDKEVDTEQSFGSDARSSSFSESPRDSRRERGELKRIEGAPAGTGWVEGVARSYDMRNKVLFVDPSLAGAACHAAERYTTRGGAMGEADTAAALVSNQAADEDTHVRSGAEEPLSLPYCARHVLDVRLLSCLSPRGHELFDQLQTFVTDFKIGLARASLDFAVDAAADLGALCRAILGDLVVEVVEQDVATEVCRDERLARAAEYAAAAAVGGVLRAAQRAVILARRIAIKGIARRRKGPQATAAAANNPGEGKLHRAKSSNKFVDSGGGDTGASKPDAAEVIDKSIATRMNFRCTAVVNERRRGNVERGTGTGGEGVAGLSSASAERKWPDLRYLTTWTVRSGVTTVVVRGRSYLDAVASKKSGGNDRQPINLEGRDAGIQRVLDHHGVSLSACLQTFDVMQDMEDPTVVLKMLASGVCQLSALYVKEGIEFSSLGQAEQEALQADVLSQLFHGTGHGAGVAPEWDELTITMQAYGGVTSVGLDQGLLVSTPSAAGWCTQKEVAAVLASPPPPQEAASSTSPSTLPEPLPPSAVDLVLALMRCNPCEVLGSLRSGIGADGRIALIGDSLGWERHRRDGEGAAVRRDDGNEGFRCSIEVAWDKDEGGVFVRRFGMEPDEKRPKFSLRAVGIRGLSVAQLPVTLEDIDEIWDQAAGDENSASGSDASTTPGHSRNSASPPANSTRSSEGGAEGRTSPAERGEASPVKPGEASASAGGTESSASIETSETPNEESASSAASATAEEEPNFVTAGPTTSTEAEVDRSPSGADQSQRDDGGKGDRNKRNSDGGDDDERSRERTSNTGVACAAKTLEGADAKQPSEGLSVDGTTSFVSDGRREGGVNYDSSSPRPGRVETTSNGEPDPVTIMDGSGVRTGEGDSGHEKEDRRPHNEGKGEFSEHAHVACGNKGRLAAEKVEDGIVDSAAGASEGTAPAVDNDDGIPSHCQEPTEGQTGGDKDEKANEGAPEDPSDPLTQQRVPESEKANAVEEPPAGEDVSPAHCQSFDPPPSLSNPEALSQPTHEVAESNSTAENNIDHLAPSVQKAEETGGDGLGQGGASSVGTVATATTTAGGRVEDSASTEKIAIAEPSESANDCPGRSTVIVPQPAGSVGIVASTNKETPNGGLVDDMTGTNQGRTEDMGESPPQRGARSSTVLVDPTDAVDDTRTASTTSPVASLAAAESKTDRRAELQVDENDEGTANLRQSPYLDGETVVEHQGPKERESSTAKNLDGVDSKTEGEARTGGTEPAEADATSASHEAGLAEEKSDTLNAVEVPDKISQRVWTFPPAFEAQVTLSTASEAVGCTLEGEVVLELGHSAKTRGSGAVHSSSGDYSEASWKSIRSVYKFSAEGGSNATIDLEDDEAQERLENLLGREYGLAMEDVLEGFSPETDLTSGEAVVQSFTDSICKLHPSLLTRSQSSTREGEEDGGESAVSNAVDAALRGGGGGGSGWREMQIRVDTSQVVEVSITTGEREADSDNGSAERGPSPAKSPGVVAGFARNITVDCPRDLSSSMLRPHLLAGGVPESAVNVLARAGFFGAGSVVDAAAVLAALAQEVRRKGLAAQSSQVVQKEEGERGWPGVDPDRDRAQVLRLLSGRETGSFHTTRECTAYITGTSKNMSVEMFPMGIDGDGSAAGGATAVRISRVRPLGSSPVVVIETDRCSEPHGNIDSTGGSSSIRVQCQDTSPKQESRREEVEGLVVGDKVEARFGGKSEWFPGVVRAIHAVHERDTPAGGGDGGAMSSQLSRVAIDYDDGDVEESVPRVRVRLPGQKQPRLLNEGDEVDVKRGKRISLARVVIRSSSSPRKEGHYDLELLDDGRRKGGGLVENCPRSAIMALHGWPPARK